MPSACSYLVPLFLHSKAVCFETSPLIMCARGVSIHTPIYRPSSNTKEILLGRTGDRLPPSQANSMIIHPNSCGSLPRIVKWILPIKFLTIVSLERIEWCHLPPSCPILLARINNSRKELQEKFFSISTR